MWLNDLFWGIRNTFVGKYHFLVINDHLWGPSVHVDKSFKKIQAGVRPPPPYRQCLDFGNFCSGIPSLIHCYNCSERTIVLWTPFFIMATTKKPVDVKICCYYIGGDRDGECTQGISWQQSAISSEQHQQHSCLWCHASHGHSSSSVHYIPRNWMAD